MSRVLEIFPLGQCVHCRARILGATQKEQNNNEIVAANPHLIGAA